MILEKLFKFFNRTTDWQVANEEELLALLKSSNKYKPSTDYWVERIKQYPNRVDEIFSAFGKERSFFGLIKNKSHIGYKLTDSKKWFELLDHFAKTKQPSDHRLALKRQVKRFAVDVANDWEKKHLKDVLSKKSIEDIKYTFGANNNYANIQKHNKEADALSSDSTKYKEVLSRLEPLNLDKTKLAEPEGDKSSTLDLASRSQSIIDALNLATTVNFIKGLFNNVDLISKRATSEKSALAKKVQVENDDLDSEARAPLSESDTDNQSVDLALQVKAPIGGASSDNDTLTPQAKAPLSSSGLQTSQVDYSDDLKTEKHAPTEAEENDTQYLGSPCSQFTVDNLSEGGIPSHEKSSTDYRPEDLNKMLANKKSELWKMRGLDSEFDSPLVRNIRDNCGESQQDDINIEPPAIGSNTSTSTSQTEEAASTLNSDSVEFEEKVMVSPDSDASDKIALNLDDSAATPVIKTNSALRPNPTQGSYAAIGRKFVTKDDDNEDKEDASTLNSDSVELEQRVTVSPDSCASDDLESEGHAPVSPTSTVQLTPVISTSGRYKLHSRTPEPGLVDIAIDNETDNDKLSVCRELNFDDTELPDEIENQSSSVNQVVCQN